MLMIGSFEVIIILLVLLVPILLCIFGYKAIIRIIREIKK